MQEYEKYERNLRDKKVQIRWSNWSLRKDKREDGKKEL